MDKEKIKQRAWSLLRAQLALACVAALVCGGSLVHAYDRVEQQMIGEGFSLLDGVMISTGGLNTLEVNGERFAVVSALIDRDIEQVRSEFEESCARGSLALECSMKPVLEAAKNEGAPIDPKDAARMLTQSERSSSGHTAHASCFVDPPDDPELWERIERLAETGQLSSIGSFRWLRAERGKYDPARTRVVLVWPEGPLDVMKMFGGDGDRPGEDPERAPRPPEAKRVLSTRVSATGQGMFAYESKASPRDITRHFDLQMKAEGFVPMDLHADQLPYRRAYIDDEGRVMMLESTQRDENSLVVMVELGAGRGT